MGYTVKELGNIIGRKPAMIYNYFNEDRSFFYSHREMGSNGGYVYDDEVLERLKIKVGVSNGVGQDEKETEQQIITKLTPSLEVRANEELERVRAELETIQKKYEELEARLKEVDTERKQLLEQN